MDKRIVITGLGVVSPNGVGLDNFTNAVKNGTSGIEYHETLKELGFSCCIGRVLGFGGRILTNEKKAAKYLNSPRSCPSYFHL